MADFAPLSELTHSQITTQYVLLTKLGNRLRYIRLCNATDAIISVSKDGVTENLRFMPNGFSAVDFTANKVKDEFYGLSAGDEIYIKAYSDLPTENFFYVESMIEKESP